MRIINIYKRSIDRGSNFLITLFKFLLYKYRYKKNLLCHYKVSIKGVRNIISNDILEIGMGKIGFSSRYDNTLLNLNGKLILKGHYSIGRGCRIDIAKNAKITIGKGGYINVNSTFIIMHGLTIGDNCVISWDCQFLDEDFHEINYLGEKEKKNQISIGNNVWIGCGVKIFKGTVIPDGSVIAANSIVKGVFSERNVLISGHPAKVVKQNINWK